MAFRNLRQLGYTEAEVDAEAASWTVPGIDPNTGETTTRPGKPIDNFPSPYPNTIAAAAANNNAIPPDLSLITKARHDGSNYVYSLLTGYGEPDPEKAAKLGFRNAARPVLQQALPQREHRHGAAAGARWPGFLCRRDRGNHPADVKRRCRVPDLDGGPSLVQRKQTGWFVLGFLVFATALAFLSYKQIWAGMKPKKK